MKRTNLKERYKDFIEKCYAGDPDGIDSTMIEYMSIFFELIERLKELESHTDIEGRRHD